MSLTPRGFEDIALDKILTIFSAYVTAQKAFYLVSHPGATAAQQTAAVGFLSERDRIDPPSDDDLLVQPLVVIGFDTETSKSGSGKQSKSSTATFFADLYVAKGETSDGLKVSGDKGANSRLLYLKAQIEAAFYHLSDFDLGFGPGVISKKPFGSWQNTTGTDESGEVWQVAGRWTFSLDYEWMPESPQGVPLELVSVNAGLWSGLYTIEQGD